jgi:hypothetical protein
MTQEKENKVETKNKNLIGRPTVMTPETINKLEQAFSLGCSDLEACFYAGIGKTALYEYQNEHPDFTERKAQLKEKLVLKARTVLAKALEQEDENTAKWYLERKKKEEFSTRVEQEQIAPIKVYVTKEQEEEANAHIDAVINDR